MLLGYNSLSGNFSTSAVAGVSNIVVGGDHTFVYGSENIINTGGGEYQMVVELLEPKGLGALQLAFEQLKERLQKEGLFAADRKRPVPPLPRRIGVVTSPKGAALQDILAGRNDRDRTDLPAVRARMAGILGGA